MHSSILFSFVLITLAAGRDLWSSQSTLANERSLSARRIAQIRPAILDTLHDIPGCPGEVCGNLAGAGTDALLGGADLCAQQDVADDIVTASKTFTQSNPSLAAALLDAGKTYRQTEKNTQLDPSTTPATDRNSLFCQKAPQNAELNGLVQAQSPDAKEGVFFDPQKGTVLVGDSPETVPFGQAAGQGASTGANNSTNVAVNDPTGDNTTGGDSTGTDSAGTDGTNGAGSDGTGTGGDSTGAGSTGTGSDGTGTGSDGTGTGTDGTGTGSDGTDTGSDGTGTGTDGTGTGTDGTGTGSDGTDTGSDGTDVTGTGSVAGSDGTGAGAGAGSGVVVTITQTNVFTATIPAVARRSQIPAAPRFSKIRRQQDTGAVPVNSANIPVAAAVQTPAAAPAGAPAGGDTGAVVVGAQGVGNANPGTAAQVSGGDLGLVPVSAATVAVAASPAAASANSTNSAAPNVAPIASDPSASSTSVAAAGAPAATAVANSTAGGGETVKTVTRVETITEGSGPAQATRANGAQGAQSTQGLGGFQPLGGNGNRNATVSQQAGNAGAVAGNSTNEGIPTGIVVAPQTAGANGEGREGRDGNGVRQQGSQDGGYNGY